MLNVENDDGAAKRAWHGRCIVQRVHHRMTEKEKRMAEDVDTAKGWYWSLQLESLGMMLQNLCQVNQMMTKQMATQGLAMVGWDDLEVQVDSSSDAASVPRHH